VYSRSKLGLSLPLACQNCFLWHFTLHFALFLGVFVRLAVISILSSAHAADLEKTPRQAVQRQICDSHWRLPAWRRHPVQSIKKQVSRLYSLSSPADPELSMGPFCVTRPNTTHQLTDPTQPNPLQVKKLNSTRPNPILD